MKQRALEVIKRIYERSNGTYPIIGCGGVATTEDAQAMIDAGATLVQICTEFIYNGGKAIRSLNLGLDELIRQQELEANAKS